MNTNRRSFLKTSAAASTVFGAMPLLGAAPGKKFTVALIGSGWWGMNILRVAMAAGRCKVVGLCDVYEQPLRVSADEVEGLNGDKPRIYKDYRELLKKERPEIVIIATPDHWHALPAIEAINSGAHLFLEKPTAHTVIESRAILNTAEAQGRVVQVGLHRRIGPHHVSGMEFLRSGKVGKIGHVEMFVSGGGRSAEKPTQHTDIPKGMDWEMWCGPSPYRPYHRRLGKGGWRHYLDYSNGTIGDWGVHWMDQVIWWTEEKYPRRIFSSGGRPIKGPVVFNEKESTTDAPDTQVATFEFETFTATWTNRQYAGSGATSHRYGCYFHGTNGVFHMGWRDGWTFYPSSKRDKLVHEDPKFDDERDGHNVPPLWLDFIDSIDQKRKPVADIESSHRSSTMPMLANISMRLGRSIEWDGKNEKIVGDAEADKLLRRDYRKPWSYPEV